MSQIDAHPSKTINYEETSLQKSTLELSHRNEDLEEATQ